MPQTQHPLYTECFKRAFKRCTNFIYMSLTAYKIQFLLSKTDAQVTAVISSLKA